MLRVERFSACAHSLSLAPQEDPLQYLQYPLPPAAVHPEIGSGTPSQNPLCDQPAPASPHASALRSAAEAKSLHNVRRAHDHIIQSGKSDDKFLGSVIIQAYIKCGAVDDARSWFTKMRDPNVFAWNFLIVEYAQLGEAIEALFLYGQMQQQGVIPDTHILTSMLCACGNQSDVAQGKRIHAQIAGSDHEPQLVVGNALVCMYGRCGTLRDTESVFDKMTTKNVVSWTVMIASYVQHGFTMKALQTFEHMVLKGVIPNRFTFLSILGACDTLEKGKYMHELIMKRGIDSDVVVGTSLISIYGKCGSAADAKRTFEKMPERNVVTWNAMIAVFAEHGHIKESLNLFEQVHHKGLIPDKITHINILDAFGNQGNLFKSRQMHYLIMLRGYELEVDVGTALVNMYDRCNSLEDARSVFDRIMDRNLVSWNFMIGAYARNGHIDHAVQLFEQMKQEGLISDKFVFSSMISACATQVVLNAGKRIHASVRAVGLASDLVVSTALVNMYGKCGSLEHAKTIFDSMSKRDGVAWNAMAAGYAQYEHGEDALEFFDRMQREGVKPDKITFVSILSACATLVALTEGRQIHSCILFEAFEADIVLATALVHMYSKCGSLQDAQRLFDQMPERNIVSWSAMIAAYAQHGHGSEALVFFEKMQDQGIKPNEVTFVSILSACSHAGLLDEGRQWWCSMIQDYGIEPGVDHYDCMIDLFGRVGRLDEAEGLINRMPFEPTALTWMTLLSACRNKDDIERAERAAMRIIQLDPKDPTPYIILSNLYMTAGRGDDAEKILNMLKEKGLEKPPWLSLSEVNVWLNP